MKREPMQRAAVAAVLAVMVAVAGCGGDRGEAGAPVDRDDPQAACKLLSHADIRSVVNIPPENNEINSGLWRDVAPIQDLTGVTFCRYGDSLNTLTLYVGVSSFGRDAKDFARRSFEKWRSETERKLEGSRRAALQPVKGLGQQAVWQGDARSGHLVVLDDDGVLTVTVREQEPALERARKLAAKGLRRL